MNRRNLPIGVIAALLILVTPTFADPPIVIRIEQASNATHLIVKKGTIVRFEGPIKSERQDVAIMLRVGSDVRLTGEFNKEWHLEWNPSKERYTHNTLTLSFRSANGDEVRFGRVVVDVLDNVPFKMTALGTTDNIEGNLALKIEPTGDIQADHFEMFLDDKSLGVSIDAKGQGSVDLSAQKPGPHKLIAQVVVADGGAFRMEPLEISIAGKIHLAPIATPEGAPIHEVDLRNGKTAPILLLRAQIDDPKIEAQSVAYYLDEHLLGQGAPDQELKYDPSKLFGGEHRFYTEITSVDGHHYLSADESVVITRDLKRELMDWREHLQQDREAYNVLLSSALKTPGVLVGPFGSPGLPIVNLSTAVPIWTQFKAESHEMSLKSRQFPLPGVPGVQRETLHQAMLFYISYFDAWEEASRAFLAYMRILEPYGGSPSRVVEQTQLREAYSKYTAKRQEAYNQFDKAETAVLSVAQAYGIRKF
jgi:hypothetical protein